MEARPHVADLHLVPRRVLLDPERALDQVLVAPGPHHPTEGLRRPGWSDEPRMGRLIRPLPGVHRDRLLLRRVDQRV
jgi:hypothetical protein